MTTYDPLIFGQRVRHLRRQRGLTLEQLGGLIDRPAPYLSMVENGKREPKLRLINQISEALGTTAADLLSHEPPSHRAALEVAVERIQTDPLYQKLDLPGFRVTVGTPDVALEHIVALFGAWQQAMADSSDEVELMRQAVVRLRVAARDAGNHRPDVEAVAAAALEAVGYEGNGALSQRIVMDLAEHFGFEVHSVAGFPATARSLVDRQNGVLYIPQRDALRTRAARFVIFQSLAHVALGHTIPSDYPTFLAQRLEANYLAGAFLLPEAPAVAQLQQAKERRDLAVEDLKDRFYTSYEAAAHRFTNLATAHLDIPTHFLRTDEQGIIRRSYENDGIPLPADTSGIVDGIRVCKEWPARAAFRSDETYDIYHQYTDTPAGTYWSSAHVEADRHPPHTISVGTDFEHARWFRGRGTQHEAVSRCPTGPCCREPKGAWDEHLWPVPLSLSHRIQALPQGPFPGVDLRELKDLVNTSE